MACPPVLASVRQSTATDGAGETEALAVSGRTLDQEGEPVTGARVSIVEDDVATTTDDSGAFRLETFATRTLLVEHPAFQPSSITVVRESVAQELVIELEPRFAASDTVTVKADLLGDRFSPNSIASSAWDPSESVGEPGSVLDAVVEIPGVSQNGQAGLFQVVSVRGVARQRVLTMLDGVRLTSERRAGVSASFIDPLLLGELDVLRGPASTYYGSGALGGALQLLPRNFEAWSAQVGYRSQGDEASLLAAWGSSNWSLATAYRSADDSETAEGERLFSSFEQGGFSIRRAFGGESLSSSLRLLGSRGTDIGKASNRFPERVTVYPREEHFIARWETRGAADWRARVYVHPHELETDASRPGQRQLVVNETFDYGGGYEHRLPLSKRFDGRAGIELFGREGVDARERGLDSAGVPIGEEIRSLANASKRESAAYAVINTSWRKLRLELGGRYTHDRQRNGLGSARLSTSESATSGFFGLAVDVSPSVSVLANVGSGLRFPSLSERFFTGTSGRGVIVGEPSLESERSLSRELSLRFYSRHLFLQLAAYRNEIDDYIERINVSPDVRTFRNLTSGTLEGLELEGAADFVDVPWGDKLHLRFGAHRIRGESDLGVPLADVPADRLQLTTEQLWGPWTLRLRSEWRFEKTAAGPSEVETPSAVLVGLQVGRRFGERLRLAVEGRNLFDELYLPSADDEAPYAPGRSLGLVVSYRP